MKKIIILQIFSFFLGSSFSFYGYGEDIEDNQGKSQFITELNDFSFGNQSSSIWENTLSILSLQYNYTASEIINSNFADSYLSNISYTFPLSQTSYLTFGHNPSSISNARLFINNFSYIGSDELSVSDEAIAYNVLYDNDGGISKSYFNFVRKFSKKFYLGLKYSMIYGNLEQNKIIRLYDLEYSNDEQNNLDVDYTLSDSILINSVNEFRGGSVQIETNFKSKYYDLILSTTYSLPLNIKNSFFFDENIENMQNLEQLQTYFQPNQIISYEDSKGFKDASVGFRYKIDEDYCWQLSLNHSKSYDYNGSMLNPDLDINSLNLHYIKSKSFLNASNLDNSITKIGLYYKSLGNQTMQENDYGLTLDYGIRLKDKNYFSIFIKLGQKSYKYLHLDSESYQIFGFRMDNVEKWFLKGD